MGLADLIAEQRDKHVLDKARPHLDEDEDVVHWCRASHPDERRDGFAFVTDRKLLIVWSGGPDGHGAVEWEDIQAWGVDGGAGRGPMLGVESERHSFFVHFPVGSQGTAVRVTGFLHDFAHHAPRPRWRLLKAGHGRSFEAVPMEVSVPPRSATAHTKRVVATVIGLVLVAVGLAITPVPGPWSLPVVLAGLAILASEYDWAKDVLDWVKDQARRARDKVRARRAPN
jgi:putative transmembrane protein PGPGW